MSLIFTITDYTTNPAGVSTVVNEPVGWDSTTLRLKRDDKWHGFFDFFDDSYNQMQWHGTARHILTAAYQAKGVEANCELLVQYACAETDPPTEIYRGRFVFTSYANVCSDMCYIECGVENTGCLINFKNSYEQKVDLDKLDAVDADLCGDNISETDIELFIYSAPYFMLNDYTLSTVYIGRTLTITGTGLNNGNYVITDIQQIGPNVRIVVDRPMVSEMAVICSFSTHCLPIYNGLNKTINMPARNIAYNNDWAIANTSNTYVDDVLDNEMIGQVATYFINFDWTQNNLTEISDSDRNGNVFGAKATDETPMVQMQKLYDGCIKLNLDSSITCYGYVTLSIHMHGRFFLTSADTITSIGSIQLRAGNVFDGLELIEDLQTGFNDNITGGMDINIDRDDIPITLKPGDGVYIFMRLLNLKYLSGTTGGRPSFPFQARTEIDSASLKVQVITSCEDTSTNVYMVNEAFSRIAEVNTNNCLRVKSEYFGRPDSQPYPSVTDGCGAMQCLTSGLKIRAKSNGKVHIGDTPVTPSFTLSMKELFEGLVPIHNIGMGIETDTERGYNAQWVRVEPVEYFYNNTVLMECSGVSNSKTNVVGTRLYNQATIGYAKWETESVNGLNDVFGSRTYRTAITQQNNTYRMQSELIASDLAIEVTRRQYGSSTKDWRYDNNNFIVCLTRLVKVSFADAVGVTSATIMIDSSAHLTHAYFNVGDTILIQGAAESGNNGLFTITGVIQFHHYVYLGVAGVLTTTSTLQTVSLFNVTNPVYAVQTGNVVSSQQVLFPETFLNLNITPARNALRHLKTLLAGYPGYATSQLTFTSGNANYLAGFQLQPEGCLTVNTLLAENSNLSPQTLNSPPTGYPFYRPEQVKFEYPVTWQQYLAIKDNPYGLIGYQCGSGPMQYGWIEDFQLKPYTGMGQFTLRPKIES